jgi:hypothetical protein
LGANISTSDASLYVNGISQYDCAVGAGRLGSNTSLASAPVHIAMVNEDLTNDNWIVLEFAGKSTIGSKVSFGRVAAQVKNHNFGGLQSDIVIAPVTNSGVTERVRVSGINEGAITTYPGTGGAFVVNENGADADFRVEGDNDIFLLVCDAGNDCVEVGSSSPLYGEKFGVWHSLTSLVTSGNRAGFYLAGPYVLGGGSTNYWLQFSDLSLTPSGNQTGTMVLHRGVLSLHGNFTFAQARGLDFEIWVTGSSGSLTTAYGAYININNAAGGALTTGYGVYVLNSGGNFTTWYALYVANPLGTNRFALLAEGGHVVLNENGGDYDFRVEGDTDANLLFLDASVDRFGIGTSTPQVKLDVNGGLATRATTNATITADQNDYAIGAASFFRLATDAQRTITGLTGGVDGKLLVLRNTGSFNLVLAHNSGSSAAANRILTGTGEDVVVPPDAAAILIYDATTQRWQMV